MMKFSYGKFGSMAPKVMAFKSRAITSERASEKLALKVGAWFAEKGDNIEVYRQRAITKEGWLGLWFVARFFVFYKDIPR